MNTLRIKGKEIQSLSDLQENFDLEEVVTAFLDCTLEHWLSDCFYDEQAELICELDHSDGFEVRMEICRILGIDYVASGFLTEAQQANYERKYHLIQQHSDDPELLKHVFETATNQAELAEFLRGGKRRIYLCGASFQIPIRVSHVHYIGIGYPKMEAAFTEEQYRRAGITFEGIELPTTVSEETIPIAEQAAAANGYDNFADSHNPLSSKLHFAMKARQLSKCLWLSWDSSVEGEFYRSRSGAENAAQREIDSVYDQANNFFTPGSQACASIELAERYAAFISDGCTGVVEKLVPWCGGDDLLKGALTELEQLIRLANDNLRKRFEQDLYDSSDYYRMYKRSYFHDQIRIESHDYNVDMFESELLNGIARLLHDETEYEIQNMHEVMVELQEDVNSHANTFFSRAYEAFCGYCGEIEAIAETIGTCLSEEALDKLELQQDKIAS